MTILTDRHFAATTNKESIPPPFEVRASAAPAAQPAAAADTLRIASARDARIALVDLSRALGGGWAPDSLAEASFTVAPAKAGA